VSDSLSSKGGIFAHKYQSIMSKQTKQQQWNWKNSHVKEMLWQAIVVGTITKSMKPHEVFPLFPEIAATDQSKFACRLRALHKQVKEDNQAAASDEAALVHD
jgi:hypothetical protein